MPLFMSNSGKFNGFHRYINFCRNLTFSLTKVMQLQLYKLGKLCKIGTQA